MKRISKLIAILLAVSMILPGMAQATQIDEAPQVDEPVVRIYGLDKILTAIEVSKRFYTKSDSVVLAGIDGEVDALTGTLLAAIKDAPLLLTNKDEVHTDLKIELERLGARNIYILGGKGVISDQVKDELKKDKKVTVKRIGGSNRYETAAKIVEEAGCQTNHVFLAEGDKNLVDALSIGPVSARDDMPVLLTKTEGLPDATKNALKDLKVDKVTIIGGMGAVSKKVEIQLEDLKCKINSRVEGPNRYETALAIAKEYFPNSKEGIITKGKTKPFADGLVGGYIGAKINAPILLTETDKLFKTTKNYISENFDKIFVLGGETAINDTVFKKIKTAVKALDIVVDKSTKLDKNYKGLKIAGNNVEVDLNGKTVKTLIVIGNDNIIKNGKVVNLNIEKDVKNTTLEDLTDDGNGEHEVAGGGGESIILKGNIDLRNTINITSVTPVQIRAEGLNKGKGIIGKIKINTGAAVTIRVPVNEIEVVKENKYIKIEAKVNKIVSLANTEITLGKGIAIPKTEKAKGVIALIKDSDGKEYEFVVNEDLKATELIDPKPDSVVPTPGPGPVKEPTDVNISGFDVINNVDGGKVGSAIYADAAAVIATLPPNVTINSGAATIPVTGWVDTDNYVSNAAGSYVFTATLGTIPTGFTNTGKLTAMIKVVIAEKETPVVETISATAAKVGQELNKSELSGTFRNVNGEKVEGTLEWDSDKQILEETGDYKWCFTPTNLKKYKKITGTVEVTLSNDFAGGLGTVDNPYQVSSAEQLNSIRYYLGVGIHFKQIQDIDLSAYLGVGGEGYNKGKAWVPIGEDNLGHDGYNGEFRGFYDGGTYKISGLTINRPKENYQGLFKTVRYSTAKLMNVSLTEVNIIGKEYIGGLVGYFDSKSIENCNVSGSVQGRRYIGGLVGKNVEGIIKSSYTEGSVKGTEDSKSPIEHIGGLAGVQDKDATIERSYSTSSVKGNGNYIGGLVGRNAGNIENSYAIGTVSGVENIGGLVGEQTSIGRLKNSYATGSVTGTKSGKTGGLVGNIESVKKSIVSSYYDKETTGQSDENKDYGKITAEMKIKSTFSDWDFDKIWKIDKGSYPNLK